MYKLSIPGEETMYKLSIPGEETMYKLSIPGEETIYLTGKHSILINKNKTTHSLRKKI